MRSRRSRVGSGKRKNRTVMCLEEMKFLAISTKDLPEDDAYFIEEQKEAIRAKYNLYRNRGSNPGVETKEALCVSWCLNQVSSLESDLGKSTTLPQSLEKLPEDLFSGGRGVRGSEPDSLEDSGVKVKKFAVKVVSFNPIFGFWDHFMIIIQRGRASWQELVGVLVFSAVPFTAVKAIANSPLSETLQH
ncbi:hypothetical protein Tco_0567835 [Tanacetum coccineum]